MYVIVEIIGDVKMSIVIIGESYDRCHKLLFLLQLRRPMPN